ncbi:efflux RND transporter periplasmic adaptor subunit [Natronospira bacteriovora]|uniref:Efflux RND transporter periplasmic adaptor subunit n=1 Tax=Natronospira bacteriovora TaxID=3069753 RepID=A0ABU0W5D6_9GAMM|nr:efflux RND transporter periplasmic adaptor subunit [Natronospira sp. AB-CW4]MDQ2069236.1 efflux RND transporter periplasmic adaptor subunit [Natronospira sp. AB-CW4]
MKNIKAVVLGGLAAAIALVWWFGGGPDGQRGAPDGFQRGGQAVAVETAPVEFRDIQDVANYTGTLLPESQFMLASKVSGRVRQLTVDIGDTVERGQVIARLDDEEFEQEVAEAQAALDVARAQFEDAQARRDVREREYRRLEELRQQGLASESEYDVGQSEFEAARSNVEVNRAQVAQRLAALRAAELRRSYATVRAEWNGGGEQTRVVGERFIDEGSNVSANEAIVSVLGTGALRGVTFVTDRDFARLSVGQSVAIRSDAWPGEVFPGTVARIAPQLREDTRQARVELHVPNDDGRLGPGFFVRLEIAVETIEDARVVPLDALTRHAGQRGVFLIETQDGERGEEGRVARFVPVTVGVRTPEYAQILSPAIEGDVVTLGQHRLGDGTPVRIPESG